MTARRRADPVQRFGVRAVVVFAIAIVFAILFVLLMIAVSRSSPEVLRADQRTAIRLHRLALRHPIFTHVMRIISDSGSTLAWWIILSVLTITLLLRRLPRLALFVVVTGIGSSILNGLIKAAVSRARPALDDPVAVAAGKSFPSGHSQSAIVGYGILVVILLPLLPAVWQRIALCFAVIMVLLIGFSRIALGVHYLSDVLGAYLIGSVWLLGMVVAFRTWRRESWRVRREVAQL